jgi:alpha-soluble NSF attachment protein
MLYNRQADSCLVKVATIAAQLEKFDYAVKTWETLATHCVDNKLTKWNMKDYFLKSGLCLLNLAVKFIIILFSLI